MRSAHSRTRYSRQRAISSGSGLLAGGAQRAGRDVAVAQPQAVVPRTTDVGWLAKPARWSGREQEVAGAVAGEDAAGAVAAVGRGGEADDEQPRARIAEARHRPAPVLLVAEALDLLRATRGTTAQPRAALAGDDVRGHAGEWSRPRLDGGEAGGETCASGPSARRSAAWR